MFLNTFLNLEKLENLLRNATFFTLFLTMGLYWFNAAFSKNNNFKIPTISNNSISERINLSEESLTYNQGYSVTSASAEGNTLLQSNNNTLATINFARTSMIISNLLLVFLLLVRWEKSGHFPLSNLYESLMFLAWCCTFLYLVYSTTFTVLVEKILGSIIAPSALLMNAFATFSLPKEMQQASPLVPALQSNWLMMHVTVMIISYATLIIGSLLSILLLMLNKMEFNKLRKNGTADLQSKEENKKQETNTFTNLILNLDFLSYRIIGLGFPFLTIGILSGAVWANEAWGSYWSWDPKETWALLTWLIFAIYLHTRLTKGWEGEKPAIIASLGFLVVWFCYLGVNLIGEGLHSYGFFKL